jgi:hypothetical protein
MDDAPLMKKNTKAYAPRPFSKKQKRTLRTWNIVMACVHAVMLVTFIILFTLWNKPSQSYPVTNVRIDGSFQPTAPPDLQWTATVTTDFRVLAPILILGFFALTVVEHGFYAADPWGAYTSAAERQNNAFRWVAFAPSATLMLLAIALLSGVSDRGTLLMLAVSNVSVMLMGAIVESNRERDREAGRYTGTQGRWRSVGVPTYVGWTLMLGAAGVILPTFFQRVNDARSAGRDVPTWVYAVVAPMFVWFASFGVAQAVQISPKGDTTSAVSWEVVYMILSVAAKVFLGAWVAVGIQQSTSATDAPPAPASAST